MIDTTVLLFALIAVCSGILAAWVLFPRMMR